MKSREPHQQACLFATREILGGRFHLFGRKPHLRDAGSHLCFRLQRHQPAPFQQTPRRAFIRLVGGGAVLASGLPGASAWPLALFAAGHGAWLARREIRRRPGVVAFSGQAVGWREAGEGDLTLADVRLQFRGPCAWLQARRPDGRVLRLAWWPDTLDAAGRRQLRLAVAATSRHDPILPAVAA